MRDPLGSWTEQQSPLMLFLTVVFFSLVTGLIILLLATAVLLLLSFCFRNRLYRELA